MAYQDKRCMTMRRVLACTSALCAVAVFYPTVALANPQGGVVSAGQAAITRSGTVLDVTQSTNRAVIDWSSFNINGNEQTIFKQPSATSMVLNRIHDANPSQILGTLTANGRVMLVNPNGVVFGKNAKVDVSGLIASTADIRNDDFMAGRMRFSQPGRPDARILNQGTITAKEAGLVGFVAPNVENDGVITATLGKVTLASGDTFTLDMAGDKLIEVAVTGDLPSQGVWNTGRIQADGGTVMLTASAARQIVDEVVENSGVIRANAIAEKHGEITLYAEGSHAVPGNVAENTGTTSGTSTVINSGTLTVSGDDPGETGGKVSVLGDEVGLLNGSVIDASGDAGGGTVKVGGDFHGQGSTPTSQTTMIEAGSRIDANAITSGNGGNVAVWSDGWTNFAGTIAAQGGANAGNGGFVETSGHKLHALGMVDAGSAHGIAGSWLLDPADVTIEAVLNSGMSGFVPDGSQAESVLDVSTITAALNAGTSVTVTTGGDSASGTGGGSITVASPITYTGTTGTPTLTLSAYSDITVNADITASNGPLNILLDADNHANLSGAISIAADISSNGGDIWMGGGALDASGHPTGAAYGDSIIVNGIFLKASTLNASGGNIVMYGVGGANGAIADDGILLFNASTIKTTGTGNITLTGQGYQGSDSQYYHNGIAEKGSTTARISPPPATAPSR